jgi:hypothetical protein
MFAFTREDGEAGCELDEDAAEGPHIDGACVGNAKYDFRCTVEPTLNVRVDALVRETRWTKVDNLDAWLVGGLQKDVFRFQVAVDYVLLSEVFEGLKHLYGEATDQGKWNALEIVVFDKLVQIDWKKFEADNQMFSEVAAILDLNNVVRVFGVLVLQMLQNLQLYSGLMLKLLFASNDFDCYDFSSKVILAFQRLPKAPLPKEVNHFKSVSDMIFEYDFVVAIFVVVSVVKVPSWNPFDFLRLETEKVHLWVVKKLGFFKVSDKTTFRIEFQGLTDLHWELLMQQVNWGFFNHERFHFVFWVDTSRRWDNCADRFFVWKRRLDG